MDQNIEKVADESTATAEPKKATKTKKTADSSIIVKVGRDAMKRYNLKEVYVTSDGQTFAQKGNANAHARNLENKEVITVK